MSSESDFLHRALELRERDRAAATHLTALESGYLEAFGFVLLCQS